MKFQKSEITKKMDTETLKDRILELEIRNTELVQTLKNIRKTIDQIFKTCKSELTGLEITYLNFGAEEIHKGVFAKDTYNNQFKHREARNDWHYHDKAFEEAFPDPTLRNKLSCNWNMNRWNQIDYSSKLNSIKDYSETKKLLIAALDSETLNNKSHLDALYQKELQLQNFESILFSHQHLAFQEEIRTLKETISEKNRRIQELESELDTLKLNNESEKEILIQQHKLELDKQEEAHKRIYLKKHMNPLSKKYMESLSALSDQNLELEKKYSDLKDNFESRITEVKSEFEKQESDLIREINELKEKHEAETKILKSDFEIQEREYEEKINRIKSAFS